MVSKILSPMRFPSRYSFVIDALGSLIFRANVWYDTRERREFYERSSESNAYRFILAISGAKVASVSPQLRREITLRKRDGARAEAIASA